MAFAFGGQRSIQLSYGCVRADLATPSPSDKVADSRQTQIELQQMAGALEAEWEMLECSTVVKDLNFFHCDEADGFHRAVE